jgi:hypothetical protein
MSVVPWSILNEVISLGHKNEYADTNMVRFELYCCGSKRPVRWGEIWKKGVLVVKPDEVPLLGKMIGKIDKALVDPYKHLFSSFEQMFEA